MARVTDSYTSEAEQFATLCWRSGRSGPWLVAVVARLLHCPLLVEEQTEQWMARLKRKKKFERILLI